MNIKLSDGIVIETSTRGSTGYFGSCFSLVWSMGGDNCFYAAVSNPDEKLMKYHPAPFSTALHLGSYNDSREASYVACMFKQSDDNEKIAMMLETKEFGKPIVEFPADLYNLQVYVTAEDVKRIVTEKKVTKAVKEKSIKVQKTSKPKPMTRDLVIRAIHNYCNMYRASGLIVTRLNEEFKKVKVMNVSEIEARVLRLTQRYGA